MCNIGFYRVGADNKNVTIVVNFRASLNVVPGKYTVLSKQNITVAITGSLLRDVVSNSFLGGTLG